MRVFRKKKSVLKEQVNSEEPIEAYLMTAYSEIESAMIEGILQNEGIFYLKKDTGAGGALAMHGFTNQEIEIYVKKEDYERAKEAVQKNTKEE